jgi:hypothetical protein
MSYDEGGAVEAGGTPERSVNYDDVFDVIFIQTLNKKRK